MSIYLATTGFALAVVALALSTPLAATLTLLVLGALAAELVVGHRQRLRGGVGEARPGDSIDGQMTSNQPVGPSEA